ncbi:Ni(II)/Co(II)-binding transcriptional repressor RcnR [Photobacterium sp. TY1-4]|uniref:Ni(II)/Co(II)-binding transcriptional repressor RcnR n=1 Tax=Photobacterium sp. TY1-4 TaxID=2899122 RepID=UPI0021C1AB86|nr:Ni(II)/Co(II)-binding transcriptional repressor RcnR [Photobacterium sp. TY1-4]UXI03372.1 Ni(II)/Co(II)-binding transcriptional repressor RcnR [Photobacterium sp. TY1-4]
MSHTTRDQKKLNARVSKIQGQVNGLKNMLEVEHECQDVLQQIAAIRGAVNGLMREVIKGHLIEHIVLEEDLKKREADLDVVLKVLDSYIK